MFATTLAAAAVAIIALAPSAVNAQVTSNATCLPQFQWMDNSKGQTPCVVSGYLSAQCNNGQWNVPAVTPDGPLYLAPHDAGANICRCNTVLYSLLQACSSCQGGQIGNWTDWEFNCAPTNIFIQQYPLSIPPSTSIPAWAYLNVVPANAFSPTNANAVRNAPESTALSGASSTGTRATGSQVPTGTGTQLPTRPPSPAKKAGTNAGAIAGGVVGGLLLLGLIAGIILFFVRKNKRAQLAQNNNYNNDVNNGQPAFSQVPQSPIVPFGAQSPGAKPYDPNDPSTFPVTPAPNYQLPYQGPPQGAGNTNSYYNGSQQDAFGRPTSMYSGQTQPGYPQQPMPQAQNFGAPQQHQGGYTGAAEL